jgi:molecular chaperone DnaK (HSP70)
MPLTEKDLEIQQAKIDQIKNEFDRLESLFDESLKSLGLTEEELKKVDENPSSPELRNLLKEAEAAAKKAGEDRAQALKNELSAPTTPPSRRGGAIKA